MGRTPCCDKVGLKKGRWTAEEDQLLVDYIKAHGEGSWRSLPKNAGLLRCGKSCRLRWINYLRDDLKRGNITAEEEETIIKLQAALGNRWSLIAGHLPGRTDNEIKNHWNAHLSKRAAALATGTESGTPVDSGEVFSLSAGSTVVDDASPDDCVSSAFAKRSGGNKVTGNSQQLEAAESKKKKGPPKKEKDGWAGDSRKRMKCRPAEKDVSSVGKEKKEKGRTTVVVIDDQAADREGTRNIEPKKRKKNKLMLLKQPSGVAIDDSNREPVEDVGGTGSEPIALPMKADPGTDEDVSGGAAFFAGGGWADELGLRPQVWDAVEIAQGDWTLDVLGHMEDEGRMAVDLLDGIHSDGNLLDLTSAGSPHPYAGSMLLDCLNVNCSNGSGSLKGAPPSEKLDNDSGGGWLGSAPVSAVSTTGTSTGAFTSTSSATSSYMELGEGDPCGGGEAGGPAADDGIGALPWEAEEDLWRLLPEVLGDVEAPEAAEPQQPPQLQPTQGWLPTMGGCGDYVFAIDGLDNPWLLANIFLSEADIIL